MKFKIGDRILYIKHSDNEADKSNFKIGNIYTIRDIAGTEGCYVEGKGVGLFASQYKHARIRNTKLSRKIYPNHKIIDENWIELKGV